MTHQKEEKIEETHSMESSEWDLDTFLYLHSRLLARSEAVRLTALDALMDIAEKELKPLMVTPMTLLAYGMFDVTVASGYRPHIFRFLAEVGTSEADRIMEDILTRNIRNEDFREFLDILIEKGRVDLIRDLEGKKLSKPKTEILQSSVDRLDGKESDNNIDCGLMIDMGDRAMDSGYCLDDGTRVEPDSIPVPELCMTCKKNPDEEIACDLTRMDQVEEIRKGEMFCCFANEPSDPGIDRETVFEDMRRYLSGKGR